MKNDLHFKGILMGAAMVALGSVWAAAPASAEVTEKTPGAQKAVEIVGAWVQAGAVDGPFTYKDLSGNDTKATYKDDIAPMMSTENFWGDNTASCTSCHSGNTEESLHQMDLTTAKGIMTGADALAAPPGVSILGQKEIGKGPTDWGHSKLRARLRDNRMPPGMEFDITEENRDGPCVEKGKVVANDKYGCETNAVGLVQAWVEAQASDTATFSYGGATGLTYKDNIAPLLTQENVWGPNTASCSSCHSGNTEESLHQMDLTSAKGVVTGADSLAAPPGVSILGQKEIGKGATDWGHSKLRARLRDNRMPPGVEFDITEENRDGPIVAHGKK